MTKEQLNAIDEVYPVGSRVQIITYDDGKDLRPGLLGTVEYISEDCRIFALWDNGITAGIPYYNCGRVWPNEEVWTPELKEKEVPETLDIFFSDLNPEAQKAVLRFYGCETPADGNFDLDIVPLFTLTNSGGGKTEQEAV